MRKEDEEFGCVVGRKEILGLEGCRDWSGGCEVHLCRCAVWSSWLGQITRKSFEAESRGVENETGPKRKGWRRQKAKRGWLWEEALPQKLR